MYRLLLGLPLLGAWAMGCGRTQVDTWPLTGTGGSAGTPPVIDAGATGNSGGADSVVCSNATTNHVSGSRIRAQVWVTEEGDRGWGGWWDTELNAPCSFVPFADGSYRCAPIFVDSRYTNGCPISREVFADEACTDPLYTRSTTLTSAIDGACLDTEYIVLDSGGCGASSGYAIYQLGRREFHDTVYRRTFGGYCVPDEAREQELYRKAVPVVSRFVRAELSDLGGGGRIRSMGEVAEDGTRQVEGWIDRELGSIPSRFALAEDGIARFLPRDGYVDGFSDSNCSSPLLTGANVLVCPAEEPPRYATYTPEARCGSRVVARGDAFEGRRYGLMPTDQGPSSCVAFEPLGSYATYVTTPIPPDTFQPVTLDVHHEDDGRLKPRYHTTSDGGCWFHDYWDTHLETSCSFDLAFDEEMRCLPNAELARDILFSDATCAKPAAVRFACGADSLPKYVTQSYAGNYSFVVEAWQTEGRVGEEELQTMWAWNSSGSACKPFLPSQGTYLRLRPAEPTRFMSARAQIE